MSERDPIRVGVLFSRSGNNSTTETSQLLGTLFAIDEINEGGGIGGREIEVVYHDPGSSPSRYREFAEQLILREKINVIFGCYLSNTRKTVLPVIEKWNRLLFYPTLYEGFECSGNVIYTGAAPNQNSVQLAEYMSSTYGSRVYMVGSDYIYPYESNRIMMELLQQHPNGEKIGEYYVPLDAMRSDFTSVIHDIKDKQPDFIFSTVVGNATKYFYQAYAEAGLDPSKMPIASLTTLEAEVREMGTDVAAGHISSAPYFQSISSETNRRCLERFAARFGTDATPNAGWEAAYFQVHLFAKAMALSGSDSIDVLMPYLLGMEYEAPQGNVRIDPANNHACLHPRIGVVSGDSGQFIIVREAKRPVHPDPYLVTHSLGDWTLKLGSTVEP